MNEHGPERLERIERAMAFIVDQQAQHEVRSAEADKRRADADKRWADADKRWASTEQSIRALLAIAEIHEREFGELREADKELREANREATKELREADQELREANREATKELREVTKGLGEAGKATDERLNVLINVVERHISEGHNHQRNEQ